MTRETIELATTSGKKVTIKSYLTGRESNELKRALYASVNITPGAEAGEKAKVDKIPLTAEVDREEKMLDMTIISFEGSTENPAEKIKDLPNEEYRDIVKKINDELKLNFQKAM